MKTARRVAFENLVSGFPANSYIYQEQPYEEQVQRAAQLLLEADAYVIGMGAGLSTAAGHTYGGERFTSNFGEFIERYGSQYMRDMYTAGFYPFPGEQAKWAFWARNVSVNRIDTPAMPLYKELFDMFQGKQVHILSTNVDHQPQLAGFREEQIFATQGDYGEIQCKRGCHPKVYNAVDRFKQMNQAMKNCQIPEYMVPKCPVCGGPMEMHLRMDQHFVEDDAWHGAAGRYVDFLREHKNDKVVLLELGVGFNTPTIIRFPFESMVGERKNWSLIRLNLNEAVVPDTADERVIGINEDIAKSLLDIKKKLK